MYALPKFRLSSGFFSDELNDAQLLRRLVLLASSYHAMHDAGLN